MTTPRDPATIRHLVVLGHPGLDSFNHAIARTYREEVGKLHQVTELDDLYARNFDPLLRRDELPVPGFKPRPDVASSLAQVDAAEMLVLIYPIWFGMPPAIVKGYVDRVLGADFSPEELKADLPSAALQGKRLTIFSTSAASRPWLEERGQWLALKQAFDTYLTRAFGLADCHHVHFDSIVPGLDPRFVEEHLEVVRQTARERATVLRYGDLPPRLLRQPDF
ncbi:NAD(P)H-dependent oxidoreductase [Sphingomonas sp. ST-64]|uniref:NAD(P)H-dependent oxidoreductase n=1 Tax=Sphingomonas plantiphila TaxID=3163295 RepID=A0ABW8YHV8_9SPHN